MSDSDESGYDERNKQEVVVNDTPEPELPLSNYKVKPSLHDAFKMGAVRDIIRTVLHEVLDGKNYSPNEVPEWTKRIADHINIQIKELEMRRYQHVVQVMLTQQTGAGSRYIARCCWDAESDSQISYSFTNEQIVCVVCVFGVYLY